MATNLGETMYTINQTDIFSNATGVETLDIINCYLVFRKFELDKYKNLPVPFTNIPEKGYFNCYRDYVEIAGKSIVDYIAELYEKFSFKNNHVIREKIEDTNIEEITYGKFKFLFLKSDTDLILLNYINTDISRDFFSYLPTEIKNSKDFTHIFRDNRFENNNVFQTSNTFKPFLKFADSRKEKPHKDLNIPFFKEFEIAIKNGVIYKEFSRFFCVLKGYNKVFSFHEFRNNIIIIDCDIFPEV